MKNKPFDEQMKDRLMSHTQYPPSIKEEIWENIVSELERNRNKQRMQQRVKTKKRTKISIAMAIAAFIFAFSILASESGSALINQVKQWFVPEKTVIEEVEGTKEEKQVSLAEGSTDYVIYIDQERYKMIEGDGKDRIVLKEPLDGRYPEVFMEIYEMSSQPEDAANELYEQFVKEQYPKIVAIQRVEEPMASYMTYAIGGTGGYQWNDPVIKYYVFDNTKGGSFVVKMQYFLEAAEGHGARFEQMLKNFHIVEDSMKEKEG